MLLTVDTVFTFLALLSLAILLLVILFNFYLIIKNGYYVNVNCWFCNSWTKVPYSNKNSFDCPSCLQYNGFKKDGSYNKIISEQHNGSYNLKINRPVAKVPPANGLCSLCNYKQQLKVVQLANFTPMNEKNFDQEVEHFEQQLEKACKLCKLCDTTLKVTIRNQNATLFGKRIKMLRNSKKLFVFSGSNGTFTGTSNVMNINKYVWFTVLLLLLYTIVSTVCLNLDFTYLSNHFKNIAPDYLRMEIGRMVEFCGKKIASINKLEYVKVMNNFYKNFSMKSKNIMPTLMSIAFLVNIIFMKHKRCTVLLKVNICVCWVLLVLTTGKFLKREWFSAYFSDLIKVFCSSYLLLKIRPTKTIRMQRKMVTPIKNKQPETLSEHSDIEEIDLDRKSETSDKNNTYLNSSNSSGTSSCSLNKYMVGSISPPKSFCNDYKARSDIDLNGSLKNLRISPRPVVSSPFYCLNTSLDHNDGLIRQSGLFSSFQSGTLRCSSQSTGYVSQNSESFGASNPFQIKNNSFTSLDKPILFQTLQSPSLPTQRSFLTDSFQTTRTNQFYYNKNNGYLFSSPTLRENGYSNSLNNSFCSNRSSAFAKVGRNSGIVKPGKLFNNFDGMSGRNSYHANFTYL